MRKAQEQIANISWQDYKALWSKFWLQKSGYDPNENGFFKTAIQLPMKEVRKREVALEKNFKVCKKHFRQMTFSQDKLTKVQEIIARYPDGKQKSALLPLLHLAQDENSGWLSIDAMDYVASLLEIEPIEVYEVATFYSMYNLKPVGKYVFEVCQTGPCMVRGSDDIVAYIQQKLSIKVGETTADGLFTLKTVECLGACGYAPMMQLGKFYREHLTKEKVDAIVEECIQNAVKNN